MSMVTIPSSAQTVSTGELNLTAENIPILPSNKISGLETKLESTDAEISEIKEYISSLEPPQPLDSTSTPTFASLTLENTTAGAGTALVRDSDGNLVELTSSAVFKENIVSASKVFDSRMLLELDSKFYNYIGKPDLKCVGYLAEDLEKLSPELVVHKNGAPYSILYSNFVPLIVDLLKTQDSEIKKLRLLVNETKVAVKSADPILPPEIIRRKSNNKAKVIAAALIAAVLSSLSLVPKALGIVFSR